LKWVEQWLRTVPRPSVSLRPPAHHGCTATAAKSLA